MRHAFIVSTYFQTQAFRFISPSRLHFVSPSCFSLATAQGRNWSLSCLCLAIHSLSIPSCRLVVSSTLKAASCPGLKWSHPLPSSSPLQIILSRSLSASHFPIFPFFPFRLRFLYSFRFPFYWSSIRFPSLISYVSIRSSFSTKGFLWSHLSCPGHRQRPYQAG